MLDGLSKDVAVPVSRYVSTNWVNNGCLRHSIGARVAHLALAPVSLVTGAFDLVFASIMGAKAYIHLGCNKSLTRESVDQFYAARNIVTRPYMNLVKFVNPKVHFRTANALISYRGNGFLSQHLGSMIENTGIINYCTNLDNFFARHISARLCYALVTIAFVVARIADGIISVPACAVSILIAGKFQALNNLAYRTSQAFGGIFCDINLGISGILNPIGLIS